MVAHVTWFPVVDWWAPPVSWPLVAAVVGELAFVEAGRAAGALAGAPAAGVAALGVALAGLGVATLDGRSRDAIAWFAAGATFAAALVVVSLLHDPIVLPRTVLPLVAFVAGGLALQVASARRPATRLVGWLGALVVATLGATWWTGGAARQPVEPWPHVSALVESQSRPGDLVVVAPDYARHAIAANLTSASAVHLIPAALHEGFGVGARLSEPLRVAPSHASLFLVLRVDLSSRRWSETTAALLDAARDAAAAGRAVWLIVVTSHDVAIAPVLDGDRRRLLDAAQAHLGPCESCSPNVC